MSSIKYLLVYIFIIGAMSSQAQIFPPELSCIKNDTIFWTLPTNNCGSFNSYQIFSSQNIDGPYSVLTTITNPAQTAYVDVGASLQTWYYYMQSDYNCPNETALPSDTLDNRLPRIAPIEAVSVDGDHIELSWENSPSPEVTLYIVYRITPVGTIPIDTVFNGNTYTDVNASPNTQEEFYYVLAGDDCGNTSIFDDPQHSLLIGATPDECQQTITLDWNPYENWPNGVDSYEVWVSINGAPASVVETIAGSSNAYVYQNADDATDYCFFIKAIRGGRPDIFANSNEICLTTAIVQPNRDMFLEQVSVTTDNQVGLDWTWASNAEINTYTILSSTDNVNFTEVFSTNTAPPLSVQNNYIDENATPNDSPIFYRIETLDDCNATVTSNTFSTIHLSGSPQDGQVNFLNWTALDVEGGEVLGYELFQVLNNVSSSLTTLDASQLSYQDITNLSDVTQANLCYYVEATVLMTLPDGTTKTVIVRSNLACIQQFAQILAPNAFTPTGKNPEFKPVLFFAEGADYQMVIYNRWGELIFESTDPSIGWRGKGQNGLILPQGIYMYQIRVTQTSGHIAEERGHVMLLK